MQLNEKLHQPPSNYYGILPSNGELFLTLHAGESLRKSTIFLFRITLCFIGKQFPIKFIEKKIIFSTTFQFADTNIAFVIAVFLYAFAALWQLFLQTYFGQQVQDEVTRLHCKNTKLLKKNICRV